MFTLEFVRDFALVATLSSVIVLYLTKTCRSIMHQREIENFRRSRNALRPIYIEAILISDHLKHVLRMANSGLFDDDEDSENIFEIEILDEIYSKSIPNLAQISHFPIYDIIKAYHSLRVLYTEMGVMDNRERWGLINLKPTEIMNLKPKITEVQAAFSKITEEIDAVDLQTPSRLKA